MGLIRTTYEIITEESAADGEVAERGFRDEHGTEYTVHEAIEFLRGKEPSSTHFHSGVWYSDADGDMDYRTGETEMLSYHLETKAGKRGHFTLAQQRAIFNGVTGRRR